MNKRHFLAVLCAAPVALRGQSGGGKRSIDAARDIFTTALTGSLGWKPKKFHVNPMPGVEPDELHRSLVTGDLFPWTAYTKDDKQRVRGFAGIGENGGIAFPGYKGGIGHPGGIADLLKACHVLDKKKRLPIGQIVARVSFCLNDWKSGEFVYAPEHAKLWEAPKAVGKPTLSALKNGVQLTWFLMIPGNTGSYTYAKVSLTVLPDYQTIIQREKVDYP